jgi:hypothetical protein
MNLNHIPAHNRSLVASLVEAYVARVTETRNETLFEAFIRSLDRGNNTALVEAIVTAHKAILAEARDDNGDWVDDEDDNSGGTLSLDAIAGEDDIDKSDDTEREPDEMTPAEVRRATRLNTRKMPESFKALQTEVKKHALPTMSDKDATADMRRQDIGKFLESFNYTRSALIDAGILDPKLPMNGWKKAIAKATADLAELKKNSPDDADAIEEAAKIVNAIGYYQYAREKIATAMMGTIADADAAVHGRYDLGVGEGVAEFTAEALDKLDAGDFPTYKKLESFTHGSRQFFGNLARRANSMGTLSVGKTDRWDPAKATQYGTTVHVQNGKNRTYYRALTDMAPLWQKSSKKKDGDTSKSYEAGSIVRYIDPQGSNPNGLVYRATQDTNEVPGGSDGSWDQEFAPGYQIPGQDPVSWDEVTGQSLTRSTDQETSNSEGESTTMQDTLIGGADPEFWTDADIAKRTARMTHEENPLASQLEATPTSDPKIAALIEKLPTVLDKALIRLADNGKFNERDLSHLENAAKILQVFIPNYMDAPGKNSKGVENAKFQQAIGSRHEVDFLTGLRDRLEWSLKSPEEVGALKEEIKAKLDALPDGDAEIAELAKSRGTTAQNERNRIVEERNHLTRLLSEDVDSVASQKRYIDAKTKLDALPRSKEKDPNQMAKAEKLIAIMNDNNPVKFRERIDAINKRLALAGDSTHGYSIAKAAEEAGVKASETKFVTTLIDEILADSTSPFSTWLADMDKASIDRASTVFADTGKKSIANKDGSGKGRKEFTVDARELAPFRKDIEGMTAQQAEETIGKAMGAEAIKLRKDKELRKKMSALTNRVDRQNDSDSHQDPSIRSGDVRSVTARMYSGDAADKATLAPESAVYRRAMDKGTDEWKSRVAEAKAKHGEKGLTYGKIPPRKPNPLIIAFFASVTFG